MRSYVADPRAQECLRTFEANMTKVEKIIDQRNQKRDEVYKWMKPSEIFSGAYLDAKSS